MTSDRSARVAAYGERRPLSIVDRFGNYLSLRSLRRWMADPVGKRIADIGCGFDARLIQSLIPVAGRITLVDVSLSPKLKAHPNVVCVEGHLPGILQAIPDSSHDFTLCISVLEHVPDDRELLHQLRRITSDEGTIVVNVPSWLGKSALEFSAFTLGWSPAEEMEDHKRYYDPRDLWPLLVEAGFRPSRISLRRHKFGLNTLAVCRNAK